jgi:hypothetical protein
MAQYVSILVVFLGMGLGVGQQPDRWNEMASFRKIYHLSQTKGALMKPICV